ncbi:hypothetical protein [Alicyclobacillus sp. SP_1]|uniref:hypothetical protein n=1 Tax=Alicyclobacillus sp. SP_1 TaxID=2942475 RepID=UPI00215753A5|nr:hypothetical protein [Alicyclobacillus sp. SP_1]
MKDGIQIHNIMTSLVRKRPCYHSEDDFKHSLAWEIHSIYDNLPVRLEVPFDLGDKRGYVDGTVGSTYIEVKYPTMTSVLNHRDETYHLRDCSANPMRYQFWKDVERLERLKEHMNIRGLAIMLTNYHRLWRPSRWGKPTADEEFRMEDGSIRKGTLQYANSSYEPIHLQGVYECKWHPYSRIGGVEFRYLVLEV